MGNTSSNKRGRDEVEGVNAGEHSGAHEALRKAVKRHKSGTTKAAAEKMTGRLLVKNCRLWSWVEDGLTLSDDNSAGTEPLQQFIPNE